MTIKQVLKIHSDIEIELLLSHVLGKTKEFLFLNSNYRLTRIQQDRLTQMIKRRKKGEPVAYIVGYKDFCGLRFKVNKNVLIPRPETEWILEKIKDERLKMYTGESVKILDMGTGSGCVIVSLASYFATKSLHKRASFYASDISKKALAVASQNAQAHNVKINFIQSDLLENINGKFDIVIANLPYVPTRIYEARIKNLEWEPKLALVDPVKDFNIYERFLQQISGNLKPKSLIYFEIDPLAKPHLQKWIKKYLPQVDIKFYKDYNKLWRFAEIKPQ